MKNNAPINIGEQPAAAAEHPTNLPVDYLKKPELAKRLRKTTRTIDSWMMHGYLPHLKIGKTVLFNWPAVKEHLAKNFTVGGR